MNSGRTVQKAILLSQSSTLLVASEANNGGGFCQVDGYNRRFSYVRAVLSINRQR